MANLQKASLKRIPVLCLLVVCLLMALPPFAAHAAADPALVTLRINQVFTSNSSVSGVENSFSYTLTALDTGNPMPAGSVDGIYSFAVKGTANHGVDPMSFVEAGVYRYEIKLAKPGTVAIGYHLDESAYTVTAYVRRSSGKLAPEITIQKNGTSKVGSILYEHTYTPVPSKPELMVDPPVKKTVSGTPSKTSTFQFTLSAKDQGSPMPAGSVGGVKTITIAGSGEKDFGPWVYTQEGTYFYTISEVNTGETGYTYDTNLYTITDTVKDAQGQLEVTRIVTNNANKQVQSCSFINKYSGSDNDGGSTGTGTTSSGKGPKTGDDISIEFYTITFWAGLSGMAACILCLIFMGRKRWTTEQLDM